MAECKQYWNEVSKLDLSKLMDPWHYVSDLAVYIAASIFSFANLCHEHCQFE